MRFFLSFLTIAAMLGVAPAYAASPLTADNFGERFEAAPLARSWRANAYKGECKDGYGRTCSYSVQTTTLDVQSREDGKGLRSVTINCAACKGEHLMVILPIVVKLVLPKVPPRQVGACMDASSRAIDTQSTEIVDLGAAQFIAARRGKELTMTVAFKD
ncbi:hypothetical protein [Methylocystis sp. S23]